MWDGRANLVELVANGPAGHFEGLNLRLYNREAHQWTLNFANSASGTLTQPTVGEFKQGRGEFYDQETINGRAIFVRFVISADLRRLVPLRAGVLGRRREDVGDQLDRGRHSREECRPVTVVSRDR